MGKKSFPRKPPGEARSLITKFEHTVNPFPERIGGKKQRPAVPETQENESLEKVLYLASVVESPVNLPVKTEIKNPSFGERFRRGFWSFIRGERAG